MPKLTMKKTNHFINKPHLTEYKNNKNALGS